MADCREEEAARFQSMQPVQEGHTGMASVPGCTDCPDQSSHSSFRLWLPVNQLPVYLVMIGMTD